MLTLSSMYVAEQHSSKRSEHEGQRKEKANASPSHRKPKVQLHVESARYLYGEPHALNEPEITHCF